METQKFPTARLIATFVLTVIFSAIGYMWSQARSMLQSIVAARQLNDDSVTGNTLAFWFRNSDVVGLLLVIAFIVILGWLWRREIKAFITGGASVMLFATVILGALVVTSTACAPRASTESEGTSLDDVYDVQPYETAFVVPATAGSFSDQQKFNSAKYYEEKKVASKRIVIKKENVGGAYRTTTFVYLVERIPVARQWTEDRTTGTTAANEALCAETRQSRRVCYQISMGAAVLEEDAATFLSFYPAEQLKDPKKAGVYKSSSLDKIVDNQVRNYATAVLGRETKSRKNDVDQVTVETNEIIATAFKETAEFFKNQGITVIYLGMGGDLKLDPEIQAVINKLYVAEKERQIAEVRATTTAIDASAQRNALILKGQGDAAALAELTKAVGGDTSHLGESLRWYRWDGSLLTVMLGPDTKPAISIPTPETVPTSVPAPTATPKK